MTHVVGLWDLELQAIHSIYEGETAWESNIHDLAPNGELFAISACDYVRIVNTRTMAELRRIKRIWTRDKTFAFRRGGLLAFSPAGEHLAVVGPTTVSICGVFDDRRITLHEEAIRGVFSPVEDLFAFALLDCSVRFWHADEKRKQMDLIGHQSKISDLVFSPMAVCSHLCAPMSA